MAKEISIAPKERVNITYRPATDDAAEDVELPLKMLAIGDYTGRADDRPVEDRTPLNITKANFNEVLAEHELSLEFAVADRITGEEGSDIPVKLEFNKLTDFEPDAIAKQVPQLKKLLELRNALSTLKGPLAARREFREMLQNIIDDPSKVEKLLGGE